MTSLRHVTQMDFSLSWISDVLRGLGQAAVDLQERERDTDWFDGLSMAEHLEEILGVAAVLAQTYVNRTWADLGKFSTSRPPDLKWQLMHSHARKLDNCPDVSVIELLYHLANYWKHSDDWTDWNPVGRRKHTVLALKSVGIHEDTELPCVTGMEQISRSLLNLFDDLLDALGSWRESVVEYHLAEDLVEQDDEPAQPSTEGQGQKPVP